MYLRKKIGFVFYAVKILNTFRRLVLFIFQKNVEVWRFWRVLCNKIKLSQQMSSSPIPLTHGSCVN